MTRLGPLALLLGAAACGGGGPTASAPDGVGELYRVEPADDPVLVGAVGDTSARHVVVRVSDLAHGGAAPGVEVRFEVRGGGGRLEGAAAGTAADGAAATTFVPDGRPARATLRAWVTEDPGAAVEIALLTRPLFALAGTPGSVLSVPDAAEGVLLSVPAGAALDLVPFSTAPTSRVTEYELRRGLGVTPGEAALGRAAVPLRPAAAGLAGWRAAVAPALPALAGERVPAALDVSNCRLPERRPAPLVWLSRGLALYLDEGAEPDSIRLAELARAYEERIEHGVIGLFGPPLDLDGNGRVLAVMSPSMPQDGAVYCGSVHLLNREIVYLPWDPALAAGVHAGLLAHELQHLVNASQHYRHGRTAARSDVTWLNEGFSLVAEWASGYPAGPLRRAAAWLPRANGGTPLLGEAYELRHMGGYFLFALYLGDRFGPGVYRALGESGLTGRSNVERVTGAPFRDVLRDWFLTLALADDEEAEPAWRYRSIDLSGEEERIASCGCVSVERLPGLPREELPGAGPLRILRTLHGQDADFLRLPPRGRPATLYFQAGGNRDVELAVVHRRPGG